MKQSPLLSLSLPPEGIRLGEKRLFPDFSFTWKLGEQWGIIGPNGSGKSVLLNLLSGLLFHPDAEVEYGFEGRYGRDPETSISLVSLERQAILLSRFESYVQMRWHSSEEETTPSVDCFLSRESVEDIAPYETHLLRPEQFVSYNARKEKILSQMQLLGLRNQPIVSLSNGETRRTLLARALLAQPELLLLDAPYVGLDSASRTLLADTISSLVESGRSSVMIASVRREELPQGLTHLIELDENGKILYQGPFRRRKQSVNRKAVLTKTKQSGGTTPETRVPTHFTLSGTPSSGKTLVEMRNVSVVYDGTPIFENLSWCIHAGERWLLTGPNGCGKTTLLAFIIGDHPQAYSNEVRLFGRQRGSGESIWSIKKRIGWVSPELHSCISRTMPLLDVVLLGYQDSPIGGKLHTPARIKRAKEELRRFGLEGQESTPFGALSSGAQRLVLLARALVKKPPLLVLDEPCQNLDAAHRNQFVDIIDSLCRENSALTLLYVTHLSDTAPQCIDHRITAKSTH